jgi:hypothetical protein
MLVQVYGDNAIKKTAVYKWMTCFSEGRASVTGKVRAGRPATSRTEESIAKVRKLNENRWLTVRSIAEQVNILNEDLHMRKVCAKMVPQELTEEQTNKGVLS